MKFAHTFRTELKRQNFPPQWVEIAIPYGQLKKCLKKVQKELSDLGLEPETLSDLLEPDSELPIGLEYKLEPINPHTLQTRLIVTRKDNGMSVSAALSPAARKFVEVVLGESSRLSTCESEGSQEESPRSSLDTDSSPDDAPGEPAPTVAPAPAEGGDQFHVPLVHDEEFLNILLRNVAKLEALQATQERHMSAEVAALSQTVTRLAKPTHFARNDLDKWRAVFRAYLDAQVFFSTREKDHGYRAQTHAASQLQWFTQEVERAKVVRGFRLPESRAVYERFVRLNVDLLRNLHFQEINKLAVTKILKKLNKRTSLDVREIFPDTAASGRLLAGSTAREICAQISTELVTVVPQVADYLCPVCFSIAFRPIRLSCDHVFCIRCVVKLQRQREEHCPFCRSDTVMTATPDNLDFKLERYMRKYFPRETREKQKANDLERAIEMHGPNLPQESCCVM